MQEPEVIPPGGSNRTADVANARSRAILQALIIRQFSE